MFNIGFGEILVILVIAFVVVGPRGLPGLARSAGRLWREIRRYAEEISAELRENVGDLEKELGEMPREIRKTAAALDKVSDTIAGKVETRDFLGLDAGGRRRKPAKDGKDETGSTGPVPADVPGAATRAAASTEVVADPDLETFVTGKLPKGDG
ncbi:MAG: Sec-independent protein translocase protein TatB [Deltaproteobacteria bacterium]|nr:Sec-independent protein translocase protein TatB [Deltaproteobacteria bacterium]